MANKIKGIFEPFSLFVSKQLELRKKLLFSGNRSSRPELFHQYTTQKSCIIRLSSGVNINQKNLILDENEEKYINHGLARHWILEGGVYDEDIVNWKKTEFNQDFDNIKAEKAKGVYNKETKEWEYSTTIGGEEGVMVGETAERTGGPRGGIGASGAYGDPSLRADKDGDFGIVPMPGITEAQIRTKSDDGSLREAEISFVCHNRRQLEILETLYMRPGYVLMLEWGWNPYISNDLETEYFPDPMDDFFATHYNLDELNAEIRRRKIKSGGNYDALIGFCRNFSFKANESGGYDCTTEIIAQGELLESLKSATITLPVDSTDDKGNPSEDGEVVDMFLYLLKCIDENLRKAGDKLYLKTKDTQADTETYWEKASWGEIALDVAAVGALFTGPAGWAASGAYFTAKGVSGGFDSTDNLDDDKLKHLNQTEKAYIEGFEAIIAVVQKVLRAKTSDLEHDAQQEYQKGTNNIDSLLFGTILKETAKTAYFDREGDTGEKKNIYVRWDLLCEIINKWCTPLYTSNGDPMVKLTYQTPFAKTEYDNFPERIEMTGSNGKPKYSYLNYSAPKKTTVMGDEDHRILGQSYDNRVCMMPHQEPVIEFVEKRDFFTRMADDYGSSDESDESSDESSNTDEDVIIGMHEVPVFTFDESLLPTNDFTGTNAVNNEYLNSLIEEGSANKADNLDPGLLNTGGTVEYNTRYYDAESETIKQLDISEPEPEGGWASHYEGMRTKFEPLTQDVSVEYGTNSIGMVYFNLDHLIEKYETARFDMVESTEDETKKIKRLKEKFNFMDYVTGLWNDVNEACGGYYDFTIHTEHERPHVARIIDMTYQGKIEEDHPIFSFNPQGLRSITRDFNFDSKIDNDFAGTVSIAAQSPNNANSLDAMSFKAFHKNIYNRFTDQSQRLSHTELVANIDKNGEEAKAFKTRLQKDVKLYKKLMNRLQKHQSQIITSWYVGEYSEAAKNKDGNIVAKHYKFGPERAKAASKELDGLITSINQRYPLKQKDGKDHPKAGYFIPEVVSLERNAIIPLEFNVMMDGIAGIIPLNVFKVNPERLPLGYQREDIVFIVKGETQKITAGGDWTTEINGQLTLLDISPNKEGTNPIPEEIKNDNSDNEGDNIDKKSTDEVRTDIIDSSKMSHEEKINSLDPSMRAPIEKVYKVMKEKGWSPKIFFAHRTIAEQRVILAKGNSTVPFSFHNTYKDGKAAALAVDIIDKRKGYAWQIPTSHQYWQDLGAACKAEGLEWGGDWTSFKDVAHCQTPNMTVAQARAQSKPDISKEDWKWIQSKL